MTYVSPYGRLDADLPRRLAALSETLRRPGFGAFVGSGPIADLEALMRFLNSREFLEYLRTRGNDTESRFAGELLRDQETLEAVQLAADCAQETSQPHSGADPVAIIEELDGALSSARYDYRQVRRVLVDLGALADDDETTPVADLLRALLA